MVVTESESNLIIEEKTEELKTGSLKPFSVESILLKQYNLNFDSCLPYFF